MEGAEMNKLQLDKNLCNLPFDQYSRQYWVAQMIESNRVGGKPYSIIDVGGYKGKTADFQTKDKVVVCDLFDVDEPNYIKADGTKLPFKDQEFDIAVSFDALEHVPRSKRGKFISEILRVSKGVSIIAAPFDDDTHSVLKAERRLNEYYSALYGKEHKWLKEHIDNKTPLSREIEDCIKAQGYEFVKLRTNDLRIWEALQHVYFSIELDHDLGERSHELNWLYNNNLVKLDIPGESNGYRAIYFITKNQSSIKRVEQLVKSIPSQDVMYVEEFSAKIMYIFGLKYRDVVHHRDHLSKEIQTVLRHKTNQVIKHMKNLGSRSK
jgi:hypothetical protein